MHETRSPYPSMRVTDSMRSIVDETLAAWEPMFSALDHTWASMGSWTRGWAELGRPDAGHARGPGHHGGHGHHDQCGSRHGHGSGDGCSGCGDRGDHPCRDRCSFGCVPDADVLVTARPGERRVVPIEVRNPRHRDLTVSVDAGPWTSCDGDVVSVVTTVVPAPEVTIPGCSTREFVLVLEIGGGGQDKDPAGQDRQRTPLRCCTTLTSDVRVNGCGTCLRVALNVLPLDCDTVEITCCGCCC